MITIFSDEFEDDIIDEFDYDDEDELPLEEPS